MWSRISQIFIVNPKNDAPDNCLAAFIPMELIDANYLSSFKFKTRKWKEIKSGFTHFANGDIAFAKITPCFQNRKSMILKDLPNGIGAGTTELKVLRPLCNFISKEYSLFFLEAPYFIEEATFKGTANQQRIISGYLEEKLFPVPPYKEQERIVSRIKDLFLYANKYGEAQERLDNINRHLNIELRKSILQEAIQGKLVLQDPNDEPASALVEKIRAEKQRMIQIGLLKPKDAITTVIYKGDDNRYYEKINGETVPIELEYEFPESWSVTRLSAVCRLIDGERKEGSYVCLDAKFLRGKSSGDKQVKGKFVHQGDNIILVDGENSGEVFTVPCDGYMGSTFKQLWTSETMYLPYVLYVIQFNKDLLRNSKRGAAIPHLNKELFYSLIMGIPPYNEQVRIAKKINMLFDKIRH